MALFATASYETGRALNIYLIGILLGVAIMAGSLVTIDYRMRVLSFEQAPVAYVVDEETFDRPVLPNSVVIDSVGIETGLVPGRQTEGVWSIPAKSAAHLVTSARPGEPGNIILYGHNKKEIFKRLPDVSVGDEIVVIDENGESHLYVVEMTEVVSPDAEHVLDQTESEQLTIYTCTGLFDRERFVVMARPG